MADNSSIEERLALADKILDPEWANLVKKELMSGHSTMYIQHGSSDFENAVRSLLASNPNLTNDQILNQLSDLTAKNPWISQQGLINNIQHVRGETPDSANSLERELAPINSQLRSLESTWQRTKNLGPNDPKPFTEQQYLAEKQQLETQKRNLIAKLQPFFPDSNLGIMNAVRDDVNYSIDTPAAPPPPPPNITLPGGMFELTPDGQLVAAGSGGSTINATPTQAQNLPTFGQAVRTMGQPVGQPAGQPISAMSRGPNQVAASQGPTDVNGAIPNGNPQFSGPESQALNTFDLPAWGGPYSAPLTQGQIDATQGISNLVNQNPILQTINNATSVQDLGQQFVGQGPGTMALQNFATGKNNPAGSNLSASNLLINQAANAANTRTNFSPVTGFLNNFLQTAPQTSDLSGAQNDIQNAIAQGNQVGDYTPVTDFLQGVITDPSKGSDLSRSNEQFDKLFNADFSLDPLFDVQRQQFEDSNAQEQAKLREQLSGLGLSTAGSTDRIDVLNRAQDAGLNNLNALQLAAKQQAFESQENRRLQALPTLLQAETLPFQERLSASQLFGDTVGQATQERQNAANIGLQGAELEGNLVQVPFEQQMSIRNQQAGQLPLLADVLSRGTQEAFQGADIQSRLADLAANNAQIPFRENLASNQQQLAASGELSGAEQNAMDRAMQAITQQGNLYGQQYGIGAQNRQAADDAIVRMISEFGRTQGGLLNQILAFMGSQPGLNTGVGPSTASQAGSLLAGGANAVSAGADVYNAVSDNK